MERLTLKNARIKDQILEIFQSGEFKAAEDVSILSQGEKDSTGFVVIGENQSFYVVNTQPDTKKLIDQVVLLIDQSISIANQNVVKAPNTAPVPLDPEAAIKLEEIKQLLENEALL